MEVLQQMPRAQVVRVPRFCVHDVHPEISAPGPQCRHFQCLHIMHEQRRVELQQCSCVHCTAVPKFAVQPTCGIQAAMSDPQHEECFPQSSSSSQARLLEAASSSHQPTSLSSPSPAITWKKQAQEESAEQSMIPDKRSCLQRVPIHPAERLTGRPSCQKNQEYYKSCSPQELAEILRVLKTNPAVRMASVRREEVPEEGRGVFDQQLL